MKLVPIIMLFAFVLVTGSALCTSAVAATSKSHEGPETTCDPETASAAVAAAGGHGEAYGDCGSAARSAARPRYGSLWPRPRAVDRPPRWRRLGRSRPYGGGRNGPPTTPRSVAIRRDGKDLETPRPVGRPRTSMKMASKMLLYALSMFFEQMELTLYLSLYKIKLLYNTLIAPMVKGW